MQCVRIRAAAYMVLFLTRIVLKIFYIRFYRFLSLLAFMSVGMMKLQIQIDYYFHYCGSE